MKSTTKSSVFNCRLENEEGSLMDRLQRWRTEKPQGKCLTFYEKGSKKSSLSYQELWSAIEAYAEDIAIKAKPGDRAVLIIEPGMEFIVVFLACLRAGVIAVPCYTPIPGSEQRGIDVFANIATEAEASLVLLSQKLALLKRWRGKWPVSLSHGSLDYVTVSSVFDILHSKPPVISFSQLPMPSRSDVAFLQFTSGSTGDPKGVIIDHGNLACNCCYALMLFQNLDTFRQTEIVCTSWLPMYHDMGLVLATCGPLFFGGEVHFMSPVDYLVDPLIWFDVISVSQSNVSMAPNFAYNLVNRKWNSSRAAKWNLSSMRCLYNSAEPIHSATVHEFLRLVQRDVPSFPLDAYGVGYGMAESVAAIGISSYPHALVASQQHTHVLASILNAVESYAFTILVNPETLTELDAEEGAIGEVWVQSPCLSRGYWQQPELTKAAFYNVLAGRPGYWFRTGDLGFMEKGHLFISGRLKDMIIINGRNFWPQDIEASTQAAHTAIRPGCVAVFPVSVEATESFVVVAEVRKIYLDQGDAARKCEELVRLIDERVRLDHAHAPMQIVLIKEKTIPKTTSGKIRRKLTKQEWESNRLQSLLQFTAQMHSTDYEAALVWVGGVVRNTALSSSSYTNNSSSGLIAIEHQLRDYEDTARQILIACNVSAQHETLSHQGLDSLQLVELLNLLKQKFDLVDVALDMTDLYSMTSEDVVKLIVSYSRDQQDAQQSSFSPEDGTLVGREIENDTNNGGSTALPPSAVSRAASLSGMKKQPSLSLMRTSSASQYPSNFPIRYCQDLKATIEPSSQVTISYSQSQRIVMDVLVVSTVFLLVIVCFLPSVVMYRYMDTHLFSSPWSYWELDTTATPYWITLGLAMVLTLPCFFISLTVLWLTMKWLVIGRYEASFIPIFTASYYRWLLIDRLTALWEVAVYTFIAETPLAVMVYRCAGAKVAWDAVLSTPLRCPDVISIDSFSEIEGSLYPQHVFPHGVSIGSITIGRQCWIRTGSIVHRCVEIESFVKLEPLSVLPAFHKLTSGFAWQGNICVRTEETYTPSPEVDVWTYRGLQWSKLFILLSLPWMSLFGAILATRFWFLVFPTQPLQTRIDSFWFQVWIFHGTGIAWSVWVFAVKWICFGRARVGPYTPSFGHKCLRNALGYWNNMAMRLFWLHFQLNLTYLWSRLLGATISPTATVVPNCVCHPVDADLVDILDDARVSTVVFQPYDREHGFRNRITVDRSAEIGHYSLLASGVHVHEHAIVGARVYLSPQTRVESKHSITSYTNGITKKPSGPTGTYTMSQQRPIMDRNKSYTFHKDLTAFDVKIFDSWWFRVLCLISEASAVLIAWCPVWLAFYIYREMHPTSLGSLVGSLLVCIWVGMVSYLLLFAVLHRVWEVIERYFARSSAGWHKFLLLYWRWLHQVKFMFGQTVGVCFGGTIFVNWALNLAGSLVDSSASIFYMHLNDWSKYEMHAFVVINEHAFPFGHMLQKNQLRFGVSVYEAQACMAPFAVLFPHQRMGQGSYLGSHVTAIQDVIAGDDIQGTVHRLVSTTSSVVPLSRNNSCNLTSKMIESTFRSAATMDANIAGVSGSEVSEGTLQQSRSDDLPNSSNLGLLVVPTVNSERKSAVEDMV